MNITKEEQEYIKKLIDYSEDNQAILYDDVDKQERIYHKLYNKLS